MKKLNNSLLRTQLIKNVELKIDFDFTAIPKLLDMSNSKQYELLC